MMLLYNFPNGREAILRAGIEVAFRINNVGQGPRVLHNLGYINDAPDIRSTVANKNPYPN
jgi:hypothetical protein